VYKYFYHASLLPAYARLSGSQRHDSLKSFKEQLVAYVLFPRSSGAAQTGGPYFRSLWLRWGGLRGNYRAATQTPLECSQSKQSHNWWPETGKAGMPSCSLPQTIDLVFVQLSVMLH